MNKPELYACALLMNDLHIGPDSLVDFQLNWDEALRICEERGIQQIIIGGDLFESRVGQRLSVLQTVYQALCKAEAQDIEITIAEGNHDKVDQEAIFGYCHVFGKFPNLFVVDDYLEMEFPDGPTMYIMSYFPENGSFSERLQQLTDHLAPQAFNILYCHTGINGALAKSSDKEVPAKIFSAFNKVVVGHYHDRCVIDGTNIEYIGASRQKNFGEDAAKGYTILYSDGSMEFIQNTVNTRYCTIEATTVKEAKELLESRKDEKLKVKVRITCPSDAASTVDKEALLELGAAKVEVVAENADSVAKVTDFDSKYDKAGLKDEYVRFCKQKEIKNIDLGLAYLDKIN